MVGRAIDFAGDVGIAFDRFALGEKGDGIVALEGATGFIEVLGLSVEMPGEAETKCDEEGKFREAMED